jgi:hypothetical protein
MEEGLGLIFGKEAIEEYKSWTFEWAYQNARFHLLHLGDRQTYLQSVALGYEVKWSKIVKELVTAVKNARKQLQCDLKELVNHLSLEIPDRRKIPFMIKMEYGCVCKFKEREKRRTNSG